MIPEFAFVQIMERNEIVGPGNFVNEVHGHLINNGIYNISNNVPEPDPTGVHFRVNRPEINFVGRSMELHDLKQFLFATNLSQAIVVASGMGGIGKTQLIRKFIDENQSEYGNIVWINSENDETILTSFKLLLQNMLGIQTTNADRNEKDSTTVIEQVLKKLCRRKTLFVYDNVVTTKSINFVLALSPPLGEKPHIVITSRLNEWPDGIQVIQLKVWHMTESIAYISKTLTDSDNDSEADKISLAELLQHFPLAVRQATAFINQQRRRNDVFEISSYIHKYNRNTREMLHSDIFRDCSISPYAKTTYTTWIVTIDTIKADERYGKLAVRILNTIAYFAADDIKREFFVHLCEFGDVKQQADFEEDLKSAVDLLVKYCMIDSRDKQKILSIHRLVQDVIKFTLKDSHEDEPVLRDALQLTAKLITVHDPQSIAFSLHSISVFLSALQLPDLITEFGSLAITILEHLMHFCKEDQSKEFGDKIVGPLIDILGANDRVLLQIQYCIAKAYSRNFVFDKAVQMNLSIFNNQKIHFGEDDADTLKTMSQLADAYEQLGDDESAVQWYEKILEKQKKFQCENSSDILETMCKIAYSLKELDRHDAALQLYQEVYDKRKSFFEQFKDLAVTDNVVYILMQRKDQLVNRAVRLRTHPDFLTNFSGWSISSRQYPSTVQEKQILRKGVFFHLSSTAKQYIHTNTLTSHYFYLSRSHPKQH